MKAGSKLYWHNCIKALLRTWLGLDELRPAKISETECRAWAAKFTAEYDEQFFNNTLSTLRHILERAGIVHEENPADKVKRLGIKPKQLQLPETDQFEKLLSIIETSGAGQAKHCEDFVRFLAFSGCRRSEAGRVCWRDIDSVKAQIRVETAKRAKTSNAAQFRFVPIIPPMLALLTRLKERDPKPEETVCVVGECEKSLTRACKLVGIHRISVMVYACLTLALQPTMWTTKTLHQESPGILAIVGSFLLFGLGSAAAFSKTGRKIPK